jgi:hypothetical protein
MGTSKPSVVDTKVSQIAGSKASFADVGLMVQSHERGFQKSSRALALSACSSNPFIYLHAQGGVRDCGLVLLREVKLALFLEARAGVALTQDLEGRPILGELLRDTEQLTKNSVALGRDDGIREMLGLLVLRAWELEDAEGDT